MFKLGLAFVSTSGQTNFRTLVRVLIYRHVVYISSCSLILVSRYECVATVGNFYMEDCQTRFYKENRMHLTCAPGSIYTHMIDKRM
jgi:hypothetical protein